MNNETQHIITAWAEAKDRLVEAYYAATEAYNSASRQLAQATGQRLFIPAERLDIAVGRQPLKRSDITRGQPAPKPATHWECSWLDLEQEIEWLREMSAPAAWIRKWYLLVSGPHRDDDESKEPEVQDIFNAWSNAKTKFVTAYTAAADALRIAREYLLETIGQRLEFAPEDWTYRLSFYPYKETDIARGDPPPDPRHHWQVTWEQLQSEINCLQRAGSPDFWIRQWHLAKGGK